MVVLDRNHRIQMVFFMVFIATFNNISVISWRSVFLRKPEYPEKTTDLLLVTDKVYYIIVCSSPWAGVEPTTSVVMGTDCIGTWKSYYHTITTTTAPLELRWPSRLIDFIFRNLIYTDFRYWTHEPGNGIDSYHRGTCMLAWLVIWWRSTTYALRYKSAEVNSVINL